MRMLWSVPRILRVGHPALPSVWMQARFMPVRYAHFDSNAFVQRLEQAGITRQQADVLVTALTDVINESIQNFAHSLVRRDEAESHSYTQKVRHTHMHSLARASGECQADEHEGVY
jgi:hypothetical protein